MRQFSYEDRKNAGMVNHEFLSWLSQRQPHRPFFAFLNFVDAHAPYVLPAGAPYRFGTVPESEADFMFLLEGWFQVRQIEDRSPRTHPGTRFVRQLPGLPG